MTNRTAALGAELTPEEARLIAEIESVRAETWFAVSHWAKETNNLQPWQRGIAFGIGRLLAAGRSPSTKQAIQGKKLYDEATRLGFLP